jgi:HNH endonuclease
MKSCTKCKLEKQYSDFYKKKATKDGYRPECKTCTKASNDAYRETNREDVNRKAREFKANNRDKIRLDNAKYRENNLDKVRKISRDYARKNRERISEYAKEYYVANKEAIREKIREYEKLNRHKRVIREQRRRHKIRALPYDFSELDWFTCLDYFNHKCAYCVSSENNLQQEHLIPVANGGGYVKENIIPACGSCNVSKKDKEFFSWYEKSPNYNAKNVEIILNYFSFISGDGGDALSHG